MDKQTMSTIDTFHTEFRHIAEECEQIMAVYTDSQTVLDTFRMDIWEYSDIYDEIDNDTSDRDIHDYKVTVSIGYAFWNGRDGPTRQIYYLSAEYVLTYSRWVEYGYDEDGPDCWERDIIDDLTECRLVKISVEPEL